MSAVPYCVVNLPKKKCEAAGMRSGSGIMELGTFHPWCPWGGGSSACLMTEQLSFPRCPPLHDDTVEPSCVTSELLAAVANIVALCLSAERGRDPRPQ